MKTLSLLLLLLVPALAAAKLGGWIACAWLWVFAPLWLPAALLFLAAIGLLFMAVLVDVARPR